MKILLIDKGGYFLDFALRCIDAGHDVKWFLGTLKGGDRNPQGDGLGVRKVLSWEPFMKWADLILTPDSVRDSLAGLVRTIASLRAAHRAAAPAGASAPGPGEF